MKVQVQQLETKAECQEFMHNALSKIPMGLRAQDILDAELYGIKINNKFGCGYAIHCTSLERYSRPFTEEQIARLNEDYGMFEDDVLSINCIWTSFRSARYMPKLYESMIQNVESLSRIHKKKRVLAATFNPDFKLFLEKYMGVSKYSGFGFKLPSQATFLWMFLTDISNLSEALEKYNDDKMVLK